RDHPPSAPASRLWWDESTPGHRRAAHLGSDMIQPVSPPAARPLISAVTGPNCKTSVASAAVQRLQSAGVRAAGYDSTGSTDVDGVLHTARPRRSPEYLPEMIEYQARAGATAMSIEAFVGILGDGLFEHVEVDTAVCTGLER